MAQRSDIGPTCRSRTRRGPVKARKPGRRYTVSYTEYDSVYTCIYFVGGLRWAPTGYPRIHWEIVASNSWALLYEEYPHPPTRYWYTAWCEYYFELHTPYCTALAAGRAVHGPRRCALWHAHHVRSIMCGNPECLNGGVFESYEVLNTEYPSSSTPSPPRDSPVLFPFVSFPAPPRRTGSRHRLPL